MDLYNYGSTISIRLLGDKKHRYKEFFFTSDEFLIGGKKNEYYQRHKTEAEERLAAILATINSL